MTSATDVLKATTEPRRRAILRLIWDREMAAGEIATHFDVLARRSHNTFESFGKLAS